MTTPRHLEVLYYGKLCETVNGPIRRQAGYQRLGNTSGFPLVDGRLQWRPALHGPLTGLGESAHRPWRDEPGIVLRSYGLENSVWPVLAHVQERPENEKGGRHYQHARYLSVPAVQRRVEPMRPWRIYTTHESNAVVAPDEDYLANQLGTLEVVESDPPSLDAGWSEFVSQAVRWTLAGTPVVIRPVQSKALLPPALFFGIADAIWRRLPHALRGVFSAGWNVDGPTQLEGLNLSLSSGHSSRAAIYQAGTDDPWRKPRELPNPKGSNGDAIPFDEEWLKPADAWLGTADTEDTDFDIGITYGRPLTWPSEGARLDLTEPTVREWHRRPGRLAPSREIIRKTRQYLDGEGSSESPPHPMGAIQLRSASEACASMAREELLEDRSDEGWNRAFRFLFSGAPDQASMKRFRRVASDAAVPAPLRSIVVLLGPGGEITPGETADLLDSFLALTPRDRERVLAVVPEEALHRALDAPFQLMQGPSLVDLHLRWSHDSPPIQYRRWLDTILGPLMWMSRTEGQPLPPQEVDRFLDQFGTNEDRVTLLGAVERDEMPPRNALPMLESYAHPHHTLREPKLWMDRFSERLRQDPSDEVAAAWFKVLSDAKFKSEEVVVRVLEGEYLGPCTEAIEQAIMDEVQGGRIEQRASHQQRNLARYVLRHWDRFLNEALVKTSLRDEWSILVDRWPRDHRWALGRRNHFATEFDTLDDATGPDQLPSLQLARLTRALVGDTRSQVVPQSVGSLLFELACRSARRVEGAPGRFLTTCLGLRTRSMTWGVPVDTVGWDQLRLAGTLAGFAREPLGPLWGVMTNAQQAFVLLHAGPLPRGRRGKVVRLLSALDRFAAQTNRASFADHLPEDNRHALRPFFADWQQYRGASKRMGGITGTPLAFGFRGLPGDWYPAPTPKLLLDFGIKEHEHLAYVAQWYRGITDRRTVRQNIYERWVEPHLLEARVADSHREVWLEWWKTGYPTHDPVLVQQGSNLLTMSLLGGMGASALLLLAFVWLLFTGATVEEILLGVFTPATRFRDYVQSGLMPSIIALGLYLLVIYGFLWRPENLNVQLEIGPANSGDQIELVRGSLGRHYRVAAELAELLNALTGLPRYP